MHEQIGVGIIGINPDRGWARTAHIPALSALTQYKLTAVCTSRTESAKIAEDVFRVPGYADAAMMVGRPDVDLVVVTVRVPYHREILLQAIAAGKSVLCEWPLARTVEEAAELADAAEKQGVRAFVGLQARCSPVIRHVKALVSGGYLGSVLSSTLIGSGNYWGGTVLAEDAYVVDRANGATMLSIPFGHTIDAVCDCLGQVVELSAMADTRRPEVRVVKSDRVLQMTAEDQILVQARLEGGALLSAHYRGGSSAGTNLLWEINGTKGVLVVTGDSGSMQIGELRLQGAQGREPLADIAVPPEFRRIQDELPQAAINVAEAYVLIAEALHDSNNGTVPDFNTAVHRHRMLEAVRQSSNEGRRVTLSV